MPIGYRVHRMPLCGRVDSATVAPFRISTYLEEKEIDILRPAGSHGEVAGGLAAGVMDRDGQVRSRRAIAAAVIGNVFEWYDFVVYSYFATNIAKTLFPPTDEAAALLETFAAFGIGFIARPFGAIVIGWIGDKRGRKPALILTIAMMASGTALVGLIPSYASIGVLAPIVLVLARLMQGFSVGGEWGNSTAFMVEWAPEGR